jgi:hypothetical protein
VNTEPYGADTGWLQLKCCCLLGCSGRAIPKYSVKNVLGKFRYRGEKRGRYSLDPATSQESWGTRPGRFRFPLCESCAPSWLQPLTVCRCRNVENPCFLIRWYLEHRACWLVIQSSKSNQMHPTMLHR